MNINNLLSPIVTKPYLSHCHFVPLSYVDLWFHNINKLYDGVSFAISIVLTGAVMRNDFCLIFKLIINFTYSDYKIIYLLTPTSRSVRWEEVETKNNKALIPKILGQLLEPFSSI